MALLFCDGFGHVDDSSPDYTMLKWDTAFSTQTNYVMYGATYGSDGDWGMRLGIYDSAYLGKLLTSNKSEIVVGCRVKVATLHSSYQFLWLIDGTSIQIEVRAMADGSIGVYRSTSILIAQSDPGILANNTWFYFEIKVLFSQTVGTVDVRINGTTVISETGLDTCSTANESISEVRIYSNKSSTYFDDLYICDTNGTECNDFLGDIKITTLYPTSDGNSSDFTCSSGSDHYAMVDELQLTADTDHNESSTVGHKDLYGMTTFGGTGTIRAVQVTAAVKNIDAGTMNIRNLSRSGATPIDNDGADFALSQTMKGNMTVWEKEPTDDVAWTATKVNAAEFGVKVQS